MINIPTTNTDPNYRYRMPKIQCRIEGKGNGIKTNIINMADIAFALKRPPTYTTKWFGYELGTISNFNDKDNSAIVNGAHRPQELAVILDKFIEKYVLCPKCNLPEIDILITKKDTVSCACNSCGHRGDLDNAHRLASFIAKNPPDSKLSNIVGDEKKKADERRRKAAPPNPDSEDEGEGEKKKKSKSSGEKKSKRSSGEDGEKKEKKSKKSSGEDGEKKSKKSKKSSGADGEKKEKKSKKEKKEKVNDEGVQLNEALNWDSAEIVDCIKRLAEFRTANATDSQGFARELRVNQVAQCFDGALRVFVGLAALAEAGAIPDGVDGADKVGEPRRFSLTAKWFTPAMYTTFRRATQGANDFEMLCGLEQFLWTYSRGTLEDAQGAQWTLLVKKLYDDDIVGEDGILGRYDDAAPASALAAKKKLGECTVPEEAATKAAKAALAQMIDWLKEEDSDEESDEDESESEEQGAYGFTGGNHAVSSDSDSEDESSVNIDDI